MKLKPLHTFKGHIGLKGTTYEIEPFHKALTSICDSIGGDDMHGKIRVITESEDTHATKNWEMKLICPPLPEKHRVHFILEGIILAASKDKRVKSWGNTCQPTKFQ